MSCIGIRSACTISFGQQCTPDYKVLIFEKMKNGFKCACSFKNTVLDVLRIFLNSIQFNGLRTGN